jgi:hypothetical protein
MDHPSWTSDELAKIDAADELEIAPLRRDGTLRKPVVIWVVRAGDDFYVRSAYGPSNPWYRGARTTRKGRIWSGDVEKDVTIEDADATVNDEVDAAYRTKYRRYAASIVESITDTQARSTTLKLVPQAC